MADLGELERVVEERRHLVPSDGLAGQTSWSRRILRDAFGGELLDPVGEGVTADNRRR